MKINDKDVKEMFENAYEKVKDYFKKSDLQRKLEKEERKMQTSIMLKEGLIEHWKQQITDYQSGVFVNHSLITQTEKEIKELEKDIKKLIKVINLYID